MPRLSLKLDSEGGLGSLGADVRVSGVAPYVSPPVSETASLEAKSGWSRLLGVRALCKVVALSAMLTLGLASVAFAQLLPEPTLSINDITVTEGEMGAMNAIFTVTRSGNTTLISTVNFATADDTATQPSDYASSSGMLIFNSGETTKTVTVSVNGDTLDEANEEFFVNLSSLESATISDAQGVGTITDDDTPQANDDGSAGSPIAVTEDDPNGVITNVAVNDTGLGDTPIGVEVTTPLGKGRTTVNADKTITYQPNANENRPDTYKYTVTDSDGQTSTATVFLEITPGNDAPSISDIANQSTDEDAPTEAIPFTVGDVETSAGTLQVTGSSSDTTLVPESNIVLGGSGADGTVNVTPAPNQSGTATITVAVTDGAATSTDSSTLTVYAANYSPVADSQTVTVDEETSTLVTLLASDVYNSSLTYKVTSLPAHGRLYKGNSTTGTNRIDSPDLPVTLNGDQVTYVPNAND
jgi:hypothetical protein